MKSTSVMVAAIALLSAAQLTAKDIELPVQPQTLVTAAAPVAISPFCKAIMQGDAATVSKMIQLGEDVNRKSLGKAPIHFAARYNQAEILKLLLANGADLNIRCDKGYTAVKYAELSGAGEALAVLKQAEKV